MNANRPPPDWKILSFDESTTDAPETEIELKRLTALKSYNLLDEEITDPAYQEVVNYMSNAFQGTASLNLVDLERVWTVACSNSATLQLYREQRRKECCCAHTILLKTGVKTLVVPNLATDARFRESPLVQGPPYNKFYAGAPLMSRDGNYRIGTLCITDTAPRSDWTDQQSDLLTKLAAITMQHMEQKRQQAQQEPQQENTNSTMSQLHQNEQSQLLQQPPPPPQEDPQQLSSRPSSQSSLGPLSMSNHSSASAAMDPCLLPNDGNNNNLTTNYTALYEDFDHPQKQDANGTAHLAPHPTHQNVLQHPSNTSTNLLQKLQMVNKETTVQIRLFVNLLEEVMQSYPKKVALLFIVDPSLPQQIILHDAKVFRSALSLLSAACERTVNGQICLTVYQRPSLRGTPDLVFECEDTGPNVPDLTNKTVVDHVSTLSPHADCGFRPRLLANGGTGSTAWFSLPLQAAPGA